MDACKTYLLNALKTSLLFAVSGAILAFLLWAGDILLWVGFGALDSALMIPFSELEHDETFFRGIELLILGAYSLFCTLVYGSLSFGFFALRHKRSPNSGRLGNAPPAVDITCRLVFFARLRDWNDLLRRQPRHRSAQFQRHQIQLFSPRLIGLCLRRFLPDVPSRLLPWFVRCYPKNKWRIESKGFL